jgi:hypothetical protein
VSSVTGRVYTAGRDHWTQAHRRWLARQSFEHDAIEDVAQCLRRIDEQMAGIVPSWAMAPVMKAYQAMRGASLLVAVTFAAEIGDRRLTRHDSSWRSSASCQASARPAIQFDGPA